MPDMRVETDVRGRGEAKTKETQVWGKSTIAICFVIYGRRRTESWNRRGKDAQSIAQLRTYTHLFKKVLKL
jgi:hypothetical protein